MIDLAEVQPRTGNLTQPVFRAARPAAQTEALASEIRALKKQLNAVILAHNYQVPEIQDVADFVGDSLGLSQQAASTAADVIVFCGVHFMAETAKILNPGKLVLLPDLDAGCSLEASCPAPKLAELQATNPNFYTIAYINCSAAVKALSDVIVTSGNALKIVNAAPPDKDLLFVPDENLGAWVMEQTGRKMDLWRGSCYVHVEFTRDSINRIKAEHPDAVVVAHPECTHAVRMLADEVCSTEKMVTFCRDNPAKNFVIVTESGMLHRLRREVPQKNFIAGPTDHCACADCRYMKMNTLEKLRDCLATLEPQIQIPEDIRSKAERSVRRMLELSK
ncbi:MAG: quinolinate synthase NadA [Verrucomicrobia bacterium]|nr:quinolinate synthase NadA [Verrucomicrobiota bacterium]